MKKVWLLVWFILVGCTPQLAETPTVESLTLVAAANTATSAPSPSPLPPTLPAPSLTPSPLIFEDLSLDDIHSTPVTATPIVTPTPSITPIVPLEPRCPEHGSPDVFAQPVNMVELMSVILNYLNVGGQWDDLASLLTEHEINHHIMLVDFNGDAVLEAIINIDIEGDDYNREVVTIVLQCRSGEYVNIQGFAWGMYTYNHEPFLEDINNDSLPEIVMLSDFARSACSSGLTVLGWKNEQIVDYSPDYLELGIMGCISKENISFEDLDGDNVKELTLVGFTVSHISYARPRELTLTFALQDGQYRWTQLVFAPPIYRHEALDDAQRAFDTDDLLLAETYYDQAAHDDNLINLRSLYYLGPATGTNAEDYPNEYQRAFALFRLVAIRFLLGDLVGVNESLNELVTNYPAELPGSEFAVLARQLVDLLTEGQEPIEACATITSLIETSYPTLATHFDFGMNVSVTTFTDDICPFVSE